VGLGKRELTAAAGIALVAGMFFLLPPAGFQVLAASVVLLTAAEAAKLYLCRTNALLFALVLAMTVLWGAFLFFRLPALPVLVATVFLPALAVLARPQPLQGGGFRLYYATALPLLFGLPGGALAALRTHFGPEEGIKLIVYLLAVVWVSDSAAYYAGKTMGTHPVAPAVSPKKTWEGTVALHLAAVGLTVGFWGFTWTNAAAGLGMGLACFWGDLIQSLLKRDLEVKDSGGFFPGHGGFWDRTDSLLWAALALYAWKSLP
jgi:phosphatidate cytidylyltransferase